MIPVKSYAAQTEGAAGPGSCLHESEPCKKLVHEVTVSQTKAYRDVTGRVIDILRRVIETRSNITAIVKLLKQ